MAEPVVTCATRPTLYPPSLTLVTHDQPYTPTLIHIKHPYPPPINSYHRKDLKLFRTLLEGKVGEGVSLAYILYKFAKCLYVCCHIFVTMVTHPYSSAKNKDIDTKLSGYDPWGLPSTSIRSRMTLSSKSPVRNPQRPPSTHILDPPFLTHF